MSLEQRINKYLLRYPEVKKIIKRCYQRGMYAFSKKIICIGNIHCVSPHDPDNEYFFGYYDKSPWNASGRYMICLRAKDTWSNPDPVEKAELLLIDTRDNNSFVVLGTTKTWNVQQGCMAQWLGPDYESKIIYNDLSESGHYCSYVMDVISRKKRELPLPIYTVSQDGSMALSLDFSRLHNLRKGYGYAALPEKTKGEFLPDAICIWKMDLHTGEVSPLLKYTDFAGFQPTPEMIGANHKVNHLMISPNGKRFMVLHRWFQGQRKYTRLITCDIDGKNMYCLNAGGASHCYWKNDEEIIAFETKIGVGRGYFLMKDKTQDFVRLWPKIDNDGHPSYCPADNSLVVFDTYPNRSRIQEVKLCHDTDVEGKDLRVIAKVFSPFKYDNDTRCDLHPRWSRDGKRVCFDGVFEGHRGLYVIDVE